VNIFQEVFLTTSVPVDVQIILGVSCLIVAVTVVNLAVESVVRPSTRNTMTMSRIADYWIRRQKSRGFGQRHTTGRDTRLAYSYRSGGRGGLRYWREFRQISAQTAKPTPDLVH
jgi:hypothetical protein